MAVLEATNPGRVIPIENGLDDIFYRTARFWKRFSVFLSIALSIASLIVAAYASLKHPTPARMQALTVSGIVINSISISLSALTSLDWKKQATNDQAFAKQLRNVAHVHEGEQVVVTARRLVGEMEKGIEEESGVLGR